MCLVIWRGLNSGPAMHSIHFSFALGTLCAPMMAAPFLGENREEKEPSLDGDKEPSAMSESTSTVGVYYPLIGSFALVLAPAYFYFGAKESKLKGSRSSRSEVVEKKQVSNKALSRNEVAYLSCLMLCFLLVVGLDIAAGSFTATFAVRSALHSSRIDGAYLTAVYFGAFTLMRFLAIFVAARIRPVAMLAFNMATTLLATGALLFLSERSFSILSGLVGIVGFATASTYATAMLWVEEHVPVTGWISAIFEACVAAGTQAI